jgi:hypothetical protein
MQLEEQGLLIASLGYWGFFFFLKHACICTLHLIYLILHSTGD